MKLVTNSHCSDTMWGHDYMQYYQDVFLEDSLHYVGIETEDPAGYRCGWTNDWRAQYCRYSDAALVTVGPYVDTKFGYIARTTGSSSTSEHGSDTIDVANPYFRIVGTAEPLEGQQVHKVGQYTGWTNGHVSTLDYDHYLEGETTKRLRDQAVADYVSGDGDSGAPVFSTPNGAGDVYLLGIHHSNDEPDDSRFSRFVNIEEDLGALDVVAPEEVLSVELHGTDYISTDSTYTWTANAENGTGTYSYEWQRRTNHQTSTCVYQTDWTTVGTGPEYVSPESPFGYDFQLRVTVTSGSETASDNIWVSVAYPGLCPN
ncbi:MAG: hypothetical protein R6U63_12320 [Longimicrobiales bacterium]